MKKKISEEKNLQKAFGYLFSVVSALEKIEGRKFTPDEHNKLFDVLFSISPKLEAHWEERGISRYSFKNEKP